MPRFPRAALALAGVLSLAALPPARPGAGTGGGAAGGSAPGRERVRLVVDEPGRRVDVTVDGQPFTSYIWPERLKKPVLYPLRTAAGTLVTRGYPLDPRPGERVDHPHHVGLWLTHGDVNGLDFWNNSEAIPPAEAAKYGTIVHRKIVRATSGTDEGTLVVSTDWMAPTGTTLLREDTTFVFRGGTDERAVDRLTTLTALGERVVFRDSKEGMIGLRVARALEQPSDKAEIFTDASGKPTTVAKLDNAGVSGRYLSSEGKAGDAVWATRGRWTILSGKIDGQPVSLALLDHPKNPAHPTYWHARGYGLFAANPFGAKAYTDGKEELNFALGPGDSVTLRHRLLILSSEPTAEQVEARFRRFVGEVK